MFANCLSRGSYIHIFHPISSLMTQEDRPGILSSSNTEHGLLDEQPIEYKTVQGGPRSRSWDCWRCSRTLLSELCRTAHDSHLDDTGQSKVWGKDKGAFGGEGRLRRDNWGLRSSSADQWPVAALTLVETIKEADWRKRRKQTRMMWTICSLWVWSWVSRGRWKKQDGAL